MATTKLCIYKMDSCVVLCTCRPLLCCCLLTNFHAVGCTTPFFSSLSCCCSLSPYCVQHIIKRKEMLCITCGASTNKYKCPKCLDAYCSLPCYKEHQKILCQRAQKTDDKFLEDVRHKEPTLHEPFSTEDTVPRNKLELLKDCKPLENLLCNLHLRKLLSEIDVAPNAWKAMKAAMQEPLFLEFADECLTIVEPQNAFD